MSDQKTEKPSPQRLKKARKEGRFPTSRDFVASVQFALAVAIGFAVAADFFLQLEQTTVQLVAQAFSPDGLTAVRTQLIFRESFLPILLWLLTRGAAIMGAVLLLQLASTGFGIATQQLLPSGKRLNMFSRLKQMPQQNLSAMLKATLLTPVILFVVYLEVSSRLPEIANLSVIGLSAGLLQAGQMLKTLLWRLTFALLVIGLIDFVRQRQRFQKELKMSKQELKEEAKEAEGNPQMKMQIRRIQRDAARKSMMKAVPKASAVIVNPTHYAVALLYEMNSKSVPTVLAKGKNYLALRIKQKAIDNQVPIIENQPLAQALYQAADVGQEIPPQLYRAVAEVLAFIYRNMNRRP